jgi:transposase
VIETHRPIAQVARDLGVPNPSSASTRRTCRAQRLGGWISAGLGRRPLSAVWFSDFTARRLTRKAIMRLSRIGSSTPIGLLAGRALTVLGVRTQSEPSPWGEAPIASGALRSMGRSTSQETLLSDNRKYRKFTAKQKVELVLASFRGDRSVAELCRPHDISESLLRRWREQMIEADAERFADGVDRSVQAEQRRRIAELERALGRKTYELEVAGRLLWDGE